jgi:uncharacterized membrane protein
MRVSHGSNPKTDRVFHIVLSIICLVIFPVMAVIWIGLGASAPPGAESSSVSGAFLIGGGSILATIFAAVRLVSLIRRRSDQR